jgi:holo-[acyl-carrier protein] synthase
MSRLSVGADCEEVERWQGLAEAPPGDPRHALFTAIEHEYCRGFPEPAPHYAARWCAKEACRKALWPWVRADLRHIGVVNDADGRPRLEIRGLELAERGLEVAVSLSHTGRTAFAVVTAMKVGA